MSLYINWQLVWKGSKSRGFFFTPVFWGSMTKLWNLRSLVSRHPSFLISLLIYLRQILTLTLINGEIYFTGYSERAVSVCSWSFDIMCKSSGILAYTLAHHKPRVRAIGKNPTHLTEELRIGWPSSLIMWSVWANCKWKWNSTFLAMKDRIFFVTKQRLILNCRYL